MTPHVLVTVFFALYVIPKKHLTSFSDNIQELNDDCSHSLIRNSIIRNNQPKKIGPCLTQIRRGAPEYLVCTLY